MIIHKCFIIKIDVAQKTIFCIILDRIIFQEHFSLSEFLL